MSPTGPTAAATGEGLSAFPKANDTLNMFATRGLDADSLRPCCYCCFSAGVAVAVASAAVAVPAMQLMTLDGMILP